MTDLLTENARLRAALAECEAEIDAYIRQEYPLDHPIQERSRAHAFAANPARAALATPAPDAPDLTDPVVVHYNMLRGTIAKPSVAQIIHLYGSAVFLELLYKRGLCKPTATPAPDAVQEAAIDIADIENGGKQWHGEDHRVVAVRWKPYKPDGQRQMKAKGRWQEQVGSGDYWRWQNCDRPAALRAIAGDRT